MLSLLTCSSCGREYSFRSVHSVQLVCRHCKQLVLKDNAAPGQRVDLPREDMSVLCIGATGKGEKGTFEIVGRVQHFYQHGYRNLWFLLYQNGDGGWLGDWEGGYSLLSHSPSQTELGSLPTNPGSAVNIFNSSYELRRISKQTISCVEGEMPELKLQHQGFLALEFGNKQEQLVLVHAFTPTHIEAFTGTFEHFNNFAFNQVRPHHEWI